MIALNYIVRFGEIMYVSLYRRITPYIIVTALCFVAAPSSPQAMGMHGSWEYSHANPVLAIQTSQHPFIMEISGTADSRLPDGIGITFSGACNTYTRVVDVDSSGNVMSLFTTSTSAICYDWRGDFDRTANSVISGMTSIQIEDDTLIINGSFGTVLFERVP